MFGDVTGALIERAHGSDSFWSSRWFTQSLLGIVMLYLVIQKEINKLKYAGLFLLISMIIFIVLLFIHYLISDPDPEKTVDLAETKLNISFFAAIPTFISSYSYFPSFFTVFSTLKNKTNKNGMLMGCL